MPPGTDVVVLAGTGTPRATVTVDGAVDGSTTVAADGTWRVAAELDASTGTQDYSVVQGFGGRVSEPVTGSFSVAAPGAPTTDEPVAGDPSPEAPATGQPAPGSRRATSAAAAVADDIATYGTTHRVTVRVASLGGAPSGSVAVTSGDRLLATTALSGGRAVVSLPGTALRPGTHALTATYAGDGSHAPSSDVVRVQVGKATSRLQVAPIESRVAAGRRARLVVRLTSDVTPRGELVVTEKGRTVLHRAARSGRARVVLPALSRGRHVLKVRYTGSDVVSSSKTRTVVVVVR